MRRRASVEAPRSTVTIPVNDGEAAKLAEIDTFAEPLNDTDPVTAPVREIVRAVARTDAAAAVAAVPSLPSRAA